MASGDYYVDNAAGADTNGGTSAGAAIVSGTAGATDGTAVVDLSGDTPDLSGVSVGDCIRIAGDAGGIRASDIFEITAVDDGLDTVDVTPSPANTAGSLTWAIGGAWATLQKAADTVRTADTDHVWVKGGTAYTEVLNITLVAGYITPTTFEGYTTATGDGGVFTIDGEAARAYGVTDSISAAAYYIFKNMRVTDHTSHGMSLSMDNCTCKNCTFDDNTGVGAWVSDNWKFENCSFDDNGSHGCMANYVAIFVGCRAYSNAGDGLQCRNGLMYGCVTFSNGGVALNMTGSGFTIHAIINCTVDGDAKDTTMGISIAGVTAGVTACINCIVYDCATGMTSLTGVGELLVSRNNLLNSNTADYAGGADTFTGEVTAAPGFETEGSDYRLADGSAAIEAGFDASVVCGFDSGCDIGAHQREEVAPGGGGGGLLQPNKRGNKQ
jgi:hypothetical protein